MLGGRRVTTGHCFALLCRSSALVASVAWPKCRQRLHARRAFSLLNRTEIFDRLIPESHRTDTAISGERHK